MSDLHRGRAVAELGRIGTYPTIGSGITRGTVLGYDDQEWAVVTEINPEMEPTRVGFVVLDGLGDDVMATLESAWGCAEHFDAVRRYRGGEHEYWTGAASIVDGEVWSVRGPIHPEARGDGE